MNHGHATSALTGGDRLALRLALDRTFEERRVRLLFFRIAGVTVELAASLDGGRAARKGQQQREHQRRGDAASLEHVLVRDRGRDEEKGPLHGE